MQRWRKQKTQTLEDKMGFEKLPTSDQEGLEIIIL
jgi:hypothetical protein